VNIQQCFDRLNFYINKATGAYYTISELTQLLDDGQMSYYSDLQPKYGTSQRIKDILAPFRATYAFATADTASGVVTVPSASNYLDLLDIYITYTISGRNTTYVPVAMVNEDERANRLNSQIDPVTVTSPIGEITGKGIIQLWPQTTYTGKVTFFRRPLAPVFGYSVLSGRVIVYNSGTSTQLEWPDTSHNAIIIKSLATIGINLSDDEISQYAQIASTNNFNGVNRV
jgi:hypothetical protein